MSLTKYLITSKTQVKHIVSIKYYIGSMNIQYLKINIEDIDSVQIRMSFPLAYQFIEGAYNDSADFYRDPSRSNPLVDDVF